MELFKYESPWVFLRDVVLAILIIVFLGAVWINLPSNHVTEAVEEEPYFPPNHIHQVLPGDTLWGIATTYYPDKDPREIVFEIRKLNDLKDSATIYPYQLLKLPPREG